MSKFRVLKNSMLGGQISRDAVGRTDLPQYAHSCEILQNMIPMLSGGAYRRPGSLYMSYMPGQGATTGPEGNTLVCGSSPPRLIPFIVSNQDAYALLFGTNRDPNGDLGNGGGYMAYYQSTGNQSGDLTTDIIYTCTPYRCKSVESAASGTDECIYTRQGGPGAVANTGTTGSDTDSRTILDVADSLQTYDDDIWSVQFCQANDVMFLTHPDYPPQVVYVSNGGLLCVPYDYNLSGLPLAQSRPYINQNTTATALAVSSISGGTTVETTVGSTTQTLTHVGGTATLTAELTPSGGIFSSLHGPRTGATVYMETGGNDAAIFAINAGDSSTADGGGILFCQVLSVQSGTSCTVKLINGVPGAYSSGTYVSEWWESAWSNYRGWPQACAIYEQRLVMASTQHQPNALWFTATSAYGAPTSQFNGFSGNQTFSKFSALGDWAAQGVTAGATGTLANGQNYTTPQDWVYFPVDDSQGDGQSTGPLGTQPFRISLATTSLDAIQYLSPDQQLFIGTATQEWICAPENASFDVANSSCTIQSHYGSDLVQATRIGYELMFVLQNRQEIRAYQYNYFDQSFFGEPVQLFFDEYPVDEEGTDAADNFYAGRKKYRTIDWDSSRSTLWCVDTAGSFFGITRDRKLQITTWHTHQMGGYNPDNGAGNELNYSLSGGNRYTERL